MSLRQERIRAILLPLLLSAAVLSAWGEEPSVQDEDNKPFAESLPAQDADTPALAEDPPAKPKIRILELTLQAGVGLGFGTFNELVYPPAGHAHPYLSELVWEMEPCPSLDIKADLLFYERFRIGFSGSFYLPGECGTMNDYDWLYSNRDDWTHHSISRNFLESGFCGEIRLSFKFLRRGSFWLEGGIFCGLQDFAFSDKLDYLLYTSGLEDTEVYDAGDPFRDYEDETGGSNAVDYRITTVSPGLSVSAGYRFGRFGISGTIDWSPLFSYRGVDRHLARGLMFEDTVFPWHALTGRLTGTLSLTEKLFLALSGEIRWFPEGVGDSVSSDLDGNNSFLSENSAGFKGLFFHFSLTCGYIF